MFAEGLLSLIRGQGGQMPDQYTQQAPGDLGGGLLDYSQPLQALPGTMAAIPPGLLEMLSQANYGQPQGMPPAAPPEAPMASQAAPAAPMAPATFTGLSNEDGIGYGILNGQRVRQSDYPGFQYKPPGSDVPMGRF